MEGEAATAADIAGVVVDLAQGRTHGYRPGDAIACYARGMTVDMAALTSTVHQSSLRCGVALDETHPRLLAAVGLALVAGVLLALGPLKPLVNHLAYLVDGGAFTSEPTSKAR